MTPPLVFAYLRAPPYVTGVGARFFTDSLSGSKKRQFCRRTAPAQCCISLREPAKTLDDALVLQGELQGVLEQLALHRWRISPAGDGMRQSTLPARQRLGMFQRQVEKQPFNGRKGSICAPLQSVERQRQGLLVLGKGLRLPAIDLPWELVQQQGSMPVADVGWRPSGPECRPQQSQPMDGSDWPGLSRAGPSGRAVRPLRQTREASALPGPRADHCQTRTPVRPVNASSPGPAPLTRLLERECSIRKGFRAFPVRRGDRRLRASARALGGIHEMLQRSGDHHAAQGRILGGQPRNLVEHGEATIDLLAGVRLCSMERARYWPKRL